jgi:hypothetical protein
MLGHDGRFPGGSEIYKVIDGIRMRNGEIGQLEVIFVDDRFGRCRDGMDFDEDVA